MIKKCTLVCCVLLMTSGCVSRMSSDDERFAQSFPDPPDGQGGLYVIRESHFMGSTRAVDLYIDSQKIAELGSGDFYYTTLPVGSHNVMAAQYQLVNAIVTGGDVESKVLRVKLEEKQNKFVEYNYFNGTFSILSEDDGKKLVLDSDRVAEDRD